jgi:hypothetical protein
MKKFKVSGIYTEYIYAETEEQAIELFDGISDGYTIEPFDEVICEEMPLSHEKV